MKLLLLITALTTGAAVAGRAPEHFRLRDSDGADIIFRETGMYNGRPFYEAMWYDLQCYWDEKGHWYFGYTGLTSPDNVRRPWKCRNFSHGGPWRLDRVRLVGGNRLLRVTGGVPLFAGKPGNTNKQATKQR